MFVATTSNGIRIGGAVSNISFQAESGRLGPRVVFLDSGNIGPRQAIRRRERLVRQFRRNLADALAVQRPAGYFEGSRKRRFTCRRVDGPYRSPGWVRGRAEGKPFPQPDRRSIQQRNHHADGDREYEKDRSAVERQAEGGRHERLVSESEAGAMVAGRGKRGHRLRPRPANVSSRGSLRPSRNRSDAVRRLQACDPISTSQ